MKKIFAKIKQLFRNVKESRFFDTVHRAVLITEAVKTIVNSSAADIITALTPFEQDEKLLAALRKSLPYVSDVLSIAETSGKSTEDLLKQISEVLEARHGQFKKVFYRELAAAVAYALEDGKLSAWETFTLTQTVYKMLKDKELLETPGSVIE